MKTNYALLLSFESITLARRTMAGWLRVGDVAPDADDLDTALKALRRKAEALSSDANRVKLVIPNEQIRYLELPPKSRNPEELNDDIRAALDGETPYAVDELVFDWAELSDGSVQVAAAARETLDEAESFALAHDFVPVCFVAAAPLGAFHGEVFFGPASGGKNGSAPSRDAQPVSLVQPAPAARAENGDAASVAEPAISTPDEIPESVEALSDPADLTVDDMAQAVAPMAETASHHAHDMQPPGLMASVAETQASAPELPKLDTPVKPATPVPNGAGNGAATKSAQNGAAQNGASLRVEPPSARPAAQTKGGSIRASRPAPDAPLPKLAGTHSDSPGSGRAAPSIKPHGVPGAPQAKPVEPVPDNATAAPIASLQRAPDPAPAPTAEPGTSKAGFFSRRKKQQAGPAAAKRGKGAGDAAATKAGAARAQSAQRAVKAEPPVQRAKALASEAVFVPSDDEAERMTIFGARKGNEKIGGKPRFLGLMLTVALILFLAAVAAWAAVFVDDGLARFFRPSPAPTAVARLPEQPPVELAAPAAVEDAPGVELASLAPDLTGEMEEAAIRSDADPAVTPAAQSETLSPEEAQATYAATGIWQRTPSEPGLPTEVSLEDIYVASIDTSVQQFDAVALPAVKDYGTDYAMLSPASPAAPGTEFTLDERGLVVATPQGALNPDGITVYAGRPPVVPPARAPAAETEAQPSPEEDAQAKALSAKRPRTRPADLVEQTERATLAGRSLAELSVLRPKLRPAGLRPVEIPAAKPETAPEDDATAITVPSATKQAVKTSVTPVVRPRDIASIVKKARATPPPAPSRSSTAVATVAPRTVAPKVPSSTTVARSATVKNQLNLGRVNLIGVYGTPSSRRALIRLSNGRYQKVKVGDRIDGGRVAAIGDSELRYVKSGRNVVLKMPRG